MDILLGPRALDSAERLPLDRPFTASQARERGVSPNTLSQLGAAGVLRRVVRGVWASTDLPDDVGTRAHAMSLVAPRDCVVVDRHAGWLHGAEMVLAPGEHLALQPLTLFRPAGRGRVRSGLTSSGERNLRPHDITVVEGVRVTTPIRTAWDLGRVRWTDQSICGIDAMLRLEAFARDDFLRGVNRFRGMRWVTTLRAVAPLGDPRSESPGESVLRLRCHESPLPPLTPQLLVHRADGSILARLDLGNEEEKFGVEYDGAEWHSTPEQIEHDRERRDELREAGWLIGAYDKSHLFGRRRTIEDDLGALNRALRSR